MLQCGTDLTNCERKWKQIRFFKIQKKKKSGKCFFCSFFCFLKQKINKIEKRTVVE